MKIIYKTCGKTDVSLKNNKNKKGKLIFKITAK